MIVIDDLETIFTTVYVVQDVIKREHFLKISSNSEAHASEFSRILKKCFLKLY